MNSIFMSYSFNDAFAGKLMVAMKNLLPDNFILLDYSQESWGQNVGLLEFIKKCDYFICVFDCNNPNVMLELGYAMGKNKNIILIAEHNDIPYDLKNFEYIKRSDNINEIVMELNKRLYLNPPVLKEMICYSEYKENIMRAIEDKEFLDNMNYRDFEKIIYEYLKAQNIPVIYKGQAKDMGYDFHIPKLNCVVEVKKFNKNVKISLAVIRALIGTMIENDADRGIIISSTEFTKSAINFVQNLQQHIVLLSLQDLIRLDGNFETLLKQYN